jgi:hypothetical protein
MMSYVRPEKNEEEEDNGAKENETNKKDKLHLPSAV